MPRTKIQLKGQFALDRRGPEALWQQIARQLQDAIEAGRVPPGTRLPSTRTLALALAVSRNTAIAAYDELGARGFSRSRRGAGVYAHAPAVVAGFNLRAVMRAAHFPLRSISLRDPDGNSLRVSY